MKLKPALLIGLLLVGWIPACGRPAQPTPAPTADVQATVDAAVAATATAEDALQATVDAAVQATVSALPPTATPVPPVDAAALSEEEMALLIEDAVAQATTASTQYAESSAQAAADGTLTGEELETMAVYLYAAEQALAYADELIDLYDEIYGAYTSEALDELQQVATDLDAIAEDLAEIEAALEQSGEVAAQAIEQLDAALEEINALLGQSQARAQAAVEKLRQAREALAEQALSLQPDQVAWDLAGAIDLVHEFAASVKDGFADGKISPDELKNIAQRAANARASLQKHGGAQLQGLSAQIDQITGQIARGQWPQARGSLASFERSIPDRPKRK